MNRYIVPIILVLIAAGAFVTYIDSAFATVQAGKARIVELDTYISDAKTAAELLALLEAKQKELPAGYDQALNLLLPKTIDPVKLVIEVNTIALKRGLMLKSPLPITGNLKSSTTGKNVSTLTFSVEAPYAVFREFLRDLESSLALRDLSVFSFTSPALVSGGFSRTTNFDAQPVEYQVTLVSYSLPD